MTTTRKLVIAIDDGHGANTPGKRSPERLGPVLRENKFNSAVADYLKAELLRHGWQVVMTAAGDGDVSITQRYNAAAHAKAQILVSIHANAGGGTGIECLYQEGSESGHRLARLVQEEVVASSHLRDRGLKTKYTSADGSLQDVGILKGASRHNIAACLIECGFMDNPTDLKLLRSSEYRQACARAIFRAIYRYIFGVVPPEEGE